MKGSKRGINPPICQPEHADPTQVDVSANRGDSAANRKECNLSHTSPAPRVSGRSSRDLRTGVERRLRPSARSSRGRALLAANDASRVPMEARGAPIIRLDRERRRTGKERSEASPSRRASAVSSADAAVGRLETARSGHRHAEHVTCPPQSNLRSKDLEGDQSPGRRGQRASATTVAGTSPSAEKSHGDEASRTLYGAR